MSARSLPAPSRRRIARALVVAAWGLAACLPAAARGDAPPVADPPDTVRIGAPPDGIVGGSGSEDDPWLVDLDELIRQGLVVIEPATPADTVAVVPAEVDTIVVTAPAVRVSEVVRRIGRRMRQDWSGLAGATWTTLMEMETIEHDDDPERRERTVETTVMRVSVDANGEQRRVVLRRGTRRYRGGELVSSEVDSSLAEQWDWADETVGATMDAPFDLLTSNRFRYRIVDRILIGDHLIYRIGFVPRDRFRPGLRGEVWIDYGDFAIRRMRGSITGVSPYPLLIKEIPWFTLRQQRVGDRWLPADFSAEVMLRRLPLLPDRIVFRLSYRDFDLRETPAAVADGGEVAP